MQERVVSNQGQFDPTDIRHLSLAHVLPDGVVCAIDRDLGFVAILTCDEQQPQLKAAQCFPLSEMATLIPLVVSHPEYCPNEYLLASFSGSTTEKDIDQAHKRLVRAKERGGCRSHNCHAFVVICGDSHFV